jgi:DNA transformation protein and related proteins
MLGMVTDDTLYFRMDSHNRTVFKEALSAPLLNYEKKGRTIDLSFCRAPERLLDEPDELVAWARAALASFRAKAVAMKAETTRRPLRPAWARTLRMKWTRGSLKKSTFADSLSADESRSVEASDAWVQGTGTTGAVHLRISAAAHSR